VGVEGGAATASDRRQGRDGGVNVANLAPVDEDAPVYGACRPGHLGGDVRDWAAMLDDAGVDTVVCLLSEPEARRWGLPDAYDGKFEAHHVPIKDRHLPDETLLTDALDLLEQVADDGRQAAIHCNAGQGRTGIVGAAWLARRRDLEPERAVDLVETGPRRRSPREAIRDGNATEADLYDLLGRV
jgi:atypical dual specificity phosphatase